MTREYRIDTAPLVKLAEKEDFLLFAEWNSAHDIQLRVALAERLEAIAEELEHIGKILDARMK